MRRRGPSLRREILAWYSLVLIVALGLFAMAAYFLLQRALLSAESESLRVTAEAVEQVTVPRDIPRIDTQDEFVTIFNDAGERMRAIRRRTVLATGQTVETIIAPPGDVESRVLRSFLLISLILMPLTALAAALGAGILLERLLDPLGRLVETTREIGIGGLSRRVAEPERPSDLQDLAHSFNGMLMRLERAVEALRNFTADASHELKTPLTSIQGTIQVALARERSAEDLRETLAEVMEETEWMLHLVDGLLTLARSEEGLIPLQKDRVEIISLLADAVEMGQLLTTDRHVDVRLVAPATLHVYGSAGQLRQVFLNLISNAVKFTQEGRVTVTAREFEEAGGRIWADIRIADTGVGIAPEELSRVFDRFYRGDAARARPGGTGLGLAIARLLVEQHGGRIDVQSRIGHGSEFRVLLPMDADELPVDERTYGGEADDAGVSQGELPAGRATPPPR
ncbi:MAG: HAMP domain-containing sensor histidine kinase [Gemmatimonadota bacterium]